MGYQVLRVYPNSPGSRAGLKAYFDFIVAIGQTRFEKENGSLREILKASVDQKLKMVVYNTRSKSAREVEIVPTTSWGGSGLLGVSIKHSSFDRADERVWHVVEVDPGSPAYQAGFKAGEDYVIGSDSILQENDDLYNLIEAHEGKALKLFVYNTKTDNCREVICHPNSKWGGRGFLGCEFGHGLLHRIPYADSQRATSPPLMADIRNNNPTSFAAQAQQQFHQQQTSHNANQPSMSHQQTLPMLQRPNQPGFQLLQQALFDNTGPPQAKQQQQGPKSLQQPIADKAPTQPTPQVPQTFAQLANAQYQAQQQQQNQQQQQAGPSPPPPPPQQQQQQQSVVEEVLPPPPQVPQTFAQLANAQSPIQQTHVQQQQQQQGPPIASTGQSQFAARDVPVQQEQQQLSPPLPPSPPVIQQFKAQTPYNHYSQQVQQHPPIQPPSYTPLSLDKEGQNLQLGPPPTQPIPSPQKHQHHSPAGQMSQSLSPPIQAPPQPPPVPEPPIQQRNEQQYFNYQFNHQPEPATQLYNHAHLLQPAQTLPQPPPMVYPPPPPPPGHPQQQAPPQQSMLPPLMQQPGPYNHLQ